MVQSQLEKQAAEGDWSAYRALVRRRQRPTASGVRTGTSDLLHAVDKLLVLRAREVKRAAAKRRAKAREVERQRLLAKAQKLIEQAYQLAKQQEKDGDWG